MVKLTAPLSRESVLSLRAGDEVRLSGSVYSARDVAHRRLTMMIDEGEELPFDLHDQVIFYAGPTPIPPGNRCGVVGPTTSKRMDPFAPGLLAAGVRGMIGKGPRAPRVAEAIGRYEAVYFVATGGAAALLSVSVERCEIFAWPELGPEAIWRFDLVDFPVFVGIDSHGGDIFSEGIARYRILDKG